MTVGSYQLSTHKTLWFFVIDLPPGDDGKRRQHKRRGFPSKTAAEKVEGDARKAYGEASIGADGSVAAELTGWLSERELDVEETTLRVGEERRCPPGQPACASEAGPRTKSGSTWALRS